MSLFIGQSNAPPPPPLSPKPPSFFDALEYVAEISLEHDSDGWYGYAAPLLACVCKQTRRVRLPGGDTVPIPGITTVAAATTTTTTLTRAQPQQSQQQQHNQGAFRLPKRAMTALLRLLYEWRAPARDPAVELFLLPLSSKCLEMAAATDNDEVQLSTEQTAALRHSLQRYFFEAANSTNDSKLHYRRWQVLGASLDGNRRWSLEGGSRWKPRMRVLLHCVDYGGDGDENKQQKKKKKQERRCYTDSRNVVVTVIPAEEATQEENELLPLSPRWRQSLRSQGPRACRRFTLKLALPPMPPLLLNSAQRTAMLRVMRHGVSLAARKYAMMLLVMGVVDPIGDGRWPFSVEQALRGIGGGGGDGDGAMAGNMKKKRKTPPTAPLPWYAFTTVSSARRGRMGDGNDDDVVVRPRCPLPLLLPYSATTTAAAAQAQAKPGGKRRRIIVV